MTELKVSDLKAISSCIPDGAVISAYGVSTDRLKPYLPQHCDIRDATLSEPKCEAIWLAHNKNDLTGIDVVVICEIPKQIDDRAQFLRWLIYADKKVILCLPKAQISDIENSVSSISDASLTPYTENQNDSQRVTSCLIPSGRRNLNSVQQRTRVLVLSFNNVGNFGDRLGYHLLSEILPSSADVTFVHFNPWNVPETDFDLFIIGIGNSIFNPLLKDRLFSLLDRIPAAIGIFGTQYRGAISNKNMALLLGKLDTWYARHETDLLLYGKYCDNAVHLGDWLITAFPITKAQDPGPLILGEEVRQDLPLDRMIQNIQRYEMVHSPRIHPFLCALTSASVVRYYEQREYDGDNVSGKFRSMLLDIFHRDFPEGEDWEVDKNAVYRYRTYVQQQKSLLAAEIANKLEG